MSEARDITAALGGCWYGSFGTAACPVCQPERRKDQTALTLSDRQGRLMLHCKKSDCRFTEVLRAAGIARKRRREDGSPRSSAGAADTARTSGYAKQLWQASAPITGTPAETYLREVRKIEGTLPPTLRYNARTWHSPSRRNLPVLIALIEAGPGFAVLRTYLRPDGSGRADLPEREQKMMLGGTRGGHVTLQAGPGPMVVAEGIETALSLPGLLDIGSATLWAALTAPNLGALSLPEVPGHLVVATDGDEAGRRAGEALRVRAVRLGWSVEMNPAPEGRDWNDVLIERKGARHGV
ncbi:DUF7146 domain-containing protein [Paracoccus niistensis]|uniref:Toprim domain-containing protein n=1 Tax=Paracoccus niistensis TaxID=632935 RepID=A0ABV6I013_9RHOB